MTSAAEGEQAVVDPTHVRWRIGQALAVLHNLRTMQYDVAAVPTAFVAEDGHQGQRTLSSRSAQDQCGIDLQPRVPIQHKEVLS